MGIFSRIRQWLAGSPAASAHSHEHVVDGRIGGVGVGNSSRSAFLEAVLAPEGLDQALTVPQTLVMQVVEQRLKTMPDEALDLPRLPTVIPRLLAALRDPQASAREYSEIVRKDPAMASAVLRMANSSYYNTTEDEITSIERGIAALGVGGLRSLLAAAVLQPLIHVKSPLYAQFGKQLWEHSLATAVAAELLAERWREDKFKAYFLGLVHEVGAIVIFSQLVAVFKEQSGVAEPSPAAFLPLLREQSGALSARVAKLWSLPDDLVQALEQQHAPGVAGSLGRVLQVANEMAELHFLLAAGRMGEMTVERRLAELGVPREIFVRLNGLSVSS